MKPNVSNLCSQEENLSPLKVKLLTKDMDEQLKLAHKSVDVVDLPNKKIA